MVKKAKKLRKEKARPQTVQHIRGILGGTQETLAKVLGVSAKTIQSYEQGWRKIPVRVMIQLLMLLALHKQQGKTNVPCWKLRKCDIVVRKSCPSYTISRGKFCWFVAAKGCSRETKAGPALLRCMDCIVVKRLLKK